MKTTRLAAIGLFVLSVILLAGCKPDWPKCKKDDHCKENDQGQEMNYVCVNGTCRECAVDNDCREGFICRDFACVPKPECYTSSDCTGGLVCRAEKCVPECTGNEGCAAGMKCEGNRCVPDVECTGDSDCADGEMCDPSGKCVARPEPECNTSTVYFDFNSASLTSDARSTLEGNAECLKKKDGRITLEGHCDERGTEEYNLALGEKRATSVKKFLSTLGIDGTRMKVVSYGEERPANSASTEDAWSENRRVEFNVGD